MVRRDLIRIAKRIIACAKRTKHPLFRTVKDDVEGLAKQLEADVKRIQELGKGGLLEAGNFRITWDDADYVLITIFDRLPGKKPGKTLETHRIKFRP